MKEGGFIQKLFNEYKEAIEDPSESFLSGLLVSILICLAFAVAIVGSLTSKVMSDSLNFDLDILMIIIACIAIIVAIIIGTYQIKRPKDKDLIEMKILITRLNMVMQKNDSAVDEIDDTFENVKTDKKHIIQYTAFFIAFFAVILYFVYSLNGNFYNILGLLIIFMLGTVIGIGIGYWLAKKNGNVKSN